MRWHREMYECMQQKEYSDRAGVGRTTLAAWETGDKRVSVDGAVRLRDAYGISLDWLYLADDNNLPSAIRQAWRKSDLFHSANSSK